MLAFQGDVMTLADFANIGTLAGSVAVLVSLIYLNLQTRQTEKNQRAILNQGVVNRAIEMLHWASEREFAVLRARVAGGETAFDRTEVNQMQFMLRASVAVNQDCHLQHEAGLLDERMLRMTEGGLRQHFRWPVFRVVWEMIRDEFPPATATRVDALLEATPVEPPLDLAADLRRRLNPAPGPAASS
jgi:hypothetical protein